MRISDWSSDVCSSDLLAELEPHYRIDERTFAFGLGRWEHDRILGYDTRWNLPGGLGYKVVDNKTMPLSLKGRPAFRQTAFVPSGNDTQLTQLAGLALAWLLSPQPQRPPANGQEQR